MKVTENQQLTVNPYLHAKVEGEAIKLEYGTITFNIMIKHGVALMNTLNLTRVKRKKVEKV